MHCIASHFLQFIPISTIRSTNPMRIGNPFAFGRTAFFIPARGKKHTNGCHQDTTFHFLCTHLIFGHPAVISAFLLAYFQFLPT